MRKPMLGTNSALFILFFGVSLLDAMRGGHLMAAALWFLLGLVFFWADLRDRRPVAAKD